MYKVDFESKQIIPMSAVTFSALNLKERFDIQEWLAKTPEILGEGDNTLLIIAKELPVNDWVSRGIRLDLLAIDTKGKLVVIELKRDEGRGDVDWQAIKYASRCSKYQPNYIVKLLSKYAGVDETEARRMIVEHINNEIDERFPVNDDMVSDALARTPTALDVRIILVAKDFHPDIASSALWLHENKIDITCIRIKPYQDASTGDIFVVPERIIPLPVSSDYTVIAPIATKSSSSKFEFSNGERRRIHSTEATDMNSESLARELGLTLHRSTSLTPRLIEFLNILVEDKGKVDREKMKQALFDRGIGEDLGHAGRLLSNISQYLNKPQSGHLLQIIGYEVDGEIEQPGVQKKCYWIKDEYLELVATALKDLATSSAIVKPEAE